MRAGRGRDYAVAGQRRGLSGKDLYVTIEFEKFKFLPGSISEVMELTRSILRNHLSAFDGRAMTILGEIAAQFEMHGEYVNYLVSLAGDPDDAVSNGATWLFKSFLETGGALSEIQKKELAVQTEDVRHWAAQLHICQSVRFLSLESKEAEKMAHWLLPLLEHDRPFLRAWSLDALCHISTQHPDFKGAAQQARQSGLVDPAASVRARAKNICL